MITFLSRSHIGNLRESIDVLAEFIRLKVERAKHKHDGISVIVDDDGDVHAPQASTGSTMLAIQRHPQFHVGTYSMLKNPDAKHYYVPDICEIAADLIERRNEIWRPN